MTREDLEKLPLLERKKIEERWKTDKEEFLATYQKEHPGQGIPAEVIRLWSDLWLANQG